MNEKNAQRPLKGRSLLCLPRDYTVIDIETNPTPEGMEPIEIAALRVTDGKRTAAFDEFVRPSRPVDGWITALTGITDGMVRHAPLPEQVLPAFLQFIGGGLLMGYNVHFDVNCLYDACLFHTGTPLQNDFVDILRFSRRYLKTLPDRRQTTVARFFGLNTQGAHRALRDCELCDAVYRRLRLLALDDPTFSG